MRSLVILLIYWYILYVVFAVNEDYLDLKSTWMLSESIQYFRIPTKFWNQRRRARDSAYLEKFYVY